MNLLSVTIFLQHKVLLACSALMNQTFLTLLTVLRLMCRYFHRQTSDGVTSLLPSLNDLGFTTTGNE